MCPGYLMNKRLRRSSENKIRVGGEKWKEEERNLTSPRHGCT